MKILLFGGSGQLGLEIQKRALDLAFEVLSPVQSEIDITEAQQVRFLLQRVRPDLVINSAAYTAVDKAETERDIAFAVNADGAAVVAEASREIGARCIYISTDYVFAGDGSRPLREEDPVHPQNIYGASKLAGEERVLSILDKQALVVRTSSLHGQHGENFVHTMLRLFRERPEVSVVADQYMSPTWAGWLAEVLLDLARTPTYGIVHACCGGGISWFEFAQEIWNSVRIKEPAIQKCLLKKISAAEFSRPARRPQYSVFDCAKLSQILGRAPISWKDGLRGHLRDIGLI